RRLVGEEQCDFVHELAEVDRGRRTVAEIRELVLDERMRDVREPPHATYVLNPRNPGYRGRFAHSASVRERSAFRSASCFNASTMIVPISRKSSSSKPRIVAAGVPMRTPDATVGGRSSKGTVLRLTVNFTSCSRSSASLPVHSVERRSSCSRWVSVPP